MNVCFSKTWLLKGSQTSDTKGPGFKNVVKNVWHHCNSSSRRECSPKSICSWVTNPAEPPGTFWDILALGFALGTKHFQLFSLRICATKDTEKHRMNIDHGPEQQRRLKQHSVRVLRFLCPGFKTRCGFRAPKPCDTISPWAPSSHPRGRARSCPKHQQPNSSLAPRS